MQVLLSSERVKLEEGYAMQQIVNPVLPLCYQPQKSPIKTFLASRLIHF